MLMVDGDDGCTREEKILSEISRGEFIVYAQFVVSTVVSPVRQTTCFCFCFAQLPSSEGTVQIVIPVRVDDNTAIIHNHTSHKSHCVLHGWEENCIDLT